MSDVHQSLVAARDRAFDLESKYPPGAGEATRRAIDEGRSPGGGKAAKPDKPGQIHGLKKTDLPSGAKVNSYDGSIEWNKRGGYADKQFDRVETKLTKAGFERVDSRSTGNPDGSVMGNDTLFRHKSGATARFSKSYGNTKSDNWFSIKIKPAAGQKTDLSFDEFQELVGVETDDSVDRQQELRTQIQLAIAVESLRGEKR